MQHDSSEDRAAQQLAIGLGLFSVGLGVTELFAPRQLARAIGMPDASEATIRAFGAREVGNGLAILAQPDRAAWLWSRVGGDALDASYLASALNADTTDRSRLMTAIAAVLGVTALDVLAARQLSAQANGAPGSTVVRVERTTTINRSVDEVYRFWRNFENFPRFMRHLVSVETLGGRRSRWKATGPAGITVQWDADVIEEVEGQRLSWRSVEGSQIENSGSVQFAPAPGGRGTEVRVQLEYRPPAGRLGQGLAWLFGEEPEQQVHQDLHRFKQLMETGEIPLSDGYGLWRPARPAADPQHIKSLAGVQS
jgi:uncharacterized membrane protein